VRNLDGLSAGLDLAIWWNSGISEACFLVCFTPGNALLVGVLKVHCFANTSLRQCAILLQRSLRYSLSSAVSKLQRWPSKRIAYGRWTCSLDSPGHSAWRLSKWWWVQRNFVFFGRNPPWAQWLKITYSRVVIIQTKHIIYFQFILYISALLFVFIVSLGIRSWKMFSILSWHMPCCKRPIVGWHTPSSFPPGCIFRAGYKVTGRAEKNWCFTSGNKVFPPTLQPITYVTWQS